jgi:hypothetical protein
MNMRPIRKCRPTPKAAENSSPAPLYTPRATPRAASRPRAPRRSASGRLHTQELLNQVEIPQAASRARGTLLTPEDGTQIVRDSVAPVIPPIQHIHRCSPLFPDLPSSEPPPSDTEMVDAAQIPRSTIEITSDKEDEEEEEEEEEEIDYEIEWKVFVDKDPIISDLISRSDFRFFSLCKRAKEKAQDYTNKKNKDAEVLSCKAQVAGKRDRAYELTIEKSDDLAKIDKKYRQLKESSKTEIRVYITYHLESIIRIDEDDGDSTSEDEMALTQGKTVSQIRTPLSIKKNKQKKQKNKNKTQRRTATTALRAEETANEIRDAASDTRALEIARNNRCSKGSCPNRGYSCIAYGEHAHIRISSDILKRWDKAIRKGEATTLEPPRYLVGKLLEGMDSRKTAKKAREENIKDIRGLVININNGATPTPKELAEGPLRSSPVHLAGDVDQALIDYIEQWCCMRPLAARQFRDTLQKLQDETLGFNDLDIIEEKGWWPKFATAGVATALMKERKRFQRDRDTRILIEQAR